jgi:hypothetical protein
MDSNAPHPTSHPNAGKLVELARTFAGVMAPTLAKQFPELFQGPQAAEWPFFCTVGCTWIACVALHHSAVPAESRTPTEVTVQRTLAEWHPAAMAAYEDLQQFVLEKLAPEDDAGKRREVLELSVASWIVWNMMMKREIANEFGTVAAIARANKPSVRRVLATATMIWCHGLSPGHVGRLCAA